MRNVQVVKTLLSAGAKPDIIVGHIYSNKPDGIRPLHIASAKGFDEVVDILLQSGANPNVKNKTGHAAIRIFVPCIAY